MLFSRLKWFHMEGSGSDLSMKPQALPEEGRTFYKHDMYSSRKIRWVSSKLDPNGEPVCVRMPKETLKTASYPGPFSAAGKKYTDWKQLCQEKTNIPGLYKDVYGRTVFCDRERFPCFDSYDYLYEDRYYRWFYILEPDRITRVYYADGQKEIHITEDVASVEHKRWVRLQELPVWNETIG